MNRVLFSFFIGGLILFSNNLVFAGTLNDLYITKEIGEPPRVAADSVDKLGAKNIHEILGEDFVVFNFTSEVGSPVPNPGDDPPLPICQCPEDYKVRLMQRLADPQFTKALARKNLVITPNMMSLFSKEQVDQVQDIFELQGILLPQFE